MKPSSHRNDWEKLKQTSDREGLRHLAHQVALSFEDRYYYNDHFEEEYIRLLCEMATSFEDESLNTIASSALFGIIIEGLCDDFEELQIEAYNRVMSLILCYCRQTPGGKSLHRKLNEYGLKTFDELYNRAEQLRIGSDEFKPPNTPPEKIVVLSRVTIGADVAITSVILQRLHILYPQAELILVGSSKLTSIFGSCYFISLREVHYVRRGSLEKRFDSWQDLLAVLRELGGESLSTGKVLLFDTDSRLSQLGVLPLIDDRYYYFFNSRGKDSYPKKLSITELTNYWLDKVLGKSRFCYPRIWLGKSELEKAKEFTAILRRNGCRRLISVNFGVGGNSRKRVGSNFETRLLLRLLEDRSSVVLFDKGFGEEEHERAEQLLNELRDRGKIIQEYRFDQLQDTRISNGVIAFQSSIGENSALIKCSDEFIGYDSAFQHIAAALRVPTHTVFAGTNNVRFVRRWRACNIERSEVIHVDTLSHPPMFTDDDIVERVIESRNEEEV